MRINVISFQLVTLSFWQIIAFNDFLWMHEILLESIYHMSQSGLINICHHNHKHIVRHYQLNNNGHDHLVQDLHIIVCSEYLKHLIFLLACLSLKSLISKCLKLVLLTGSNVCIVKVMFLILVVFHIKLWICIRIRVSSCVCSKKVKYYNLIIMKQIGEAFQILAFVDQQLLNKVCV